MRTLQGLVAEAYLGGAEVSLREIILAAGLQDLDPLSAAVEALRIVDSYRLILDPGIGSGDEATIRILRSRERLETGAKKLDDLISEGESVSVEFKASLIADLRRLAKTGELHSREELEGEGLKSVCALMNAEGGHLLIGIADDGSCSGGIEKDVDFKHWNIDQWSLHWAGLLKQRFHEGAGIQPYIRSQIVMRDSTRVCMVEVLPRTEPAFVQRSKNGPFEFFCRFGPRTDSLSLPDFYRFMHAKSLL